MTAEVQYQSLQETFGTTTRQLRTMRRWSQERLAERSGVNEHTIIDIELNRGIPYPATVKKLADAFALSGDDRQRFISSAPSRPKMLPNGAFGELLARYRTRAKMSQQALGNVTGISPSAINRAEAGRHSPSAWVVEALARALHLSDSERDDLLIAARHQPSWAGDKTIRQVARLLAGDEVLAAGLRCQISALDRMTAVGAGR